MLTYNLLIINILLFARLFITQHRSSVDDDGHDGQDDRLLDHALKLAALQYDFLDDFYVK